MQFISLKKKFNHRSSRTFYPLSVSVLNRKSHLIFSVRSLYDRSDLAKVVNQDIYLAIEVKLFGKLVKVVLEQASHAAAIEVDYRKYWLTIILDLLFYL